MEVLITTLGQTPKYQTSGAAGVDLESMEFVVIPAEEVVLVSTGLSMAIPEGYEGQVRSRSGLALKGIVVANSPGTVDSDYRGEVKVILRNLTLSDYHVKKGDRIAQMVFAKVEHVNFTCVDELPSTVRNTGGFGSTG